MNKENIKIDHACDGSAWAEHEDFLVGNKEGLVRLQSAISEALEKGESTINSGEFIGVRCLDTEFFESNKTNVNIFSGFIAWLVMGVVAFIFIMGIKYIFSWFG